MPLTRPATHLPVELWEEIIALAAHDPSPFSPIDQYTHIHSRRARKLLRLGQADFHSRLSKLSGVCKPWRDLTERLKDQFLEVETNDELRRLGIAQRGHRSIRRRRLDVYSSAWSTKASYDSVLYDFRAVLSNTHKLEMLSLVRMGLRYPMMPDKFLLETSDLLYNLKALEYTVAPGTGVDGLNMSVLAMGYRSLEYLNCDIMILSDAFSNVPAPAFPHLRTLRTFVHFPAGPPDGFEEWLANWEMPVLTNLSLTHSLGHDDWKWLCALLRKNGRTLECVQFSKFDYATEPPFEFMEYCPRLHTFAGTNMDQLLLDIPAQHPPIHKIVVLEVYDGESILAGTLRLIRQQIWQMLRDVDRVAGAVLQFGDVTMDDLTDASDASVEALWLLIATMSKHGYQVIDTDGREIKTCLRERGLAYQA